MNAKIAATLQEFRELAPQAQLSSPGVSGWSVGQHIRHCVLAMLVIGSELRQCDTDPPPAKWSFSRFIVFRTGFIPRGKAEAPARVVPDEHVSPEELVASLKEAQAAVEESAELPASKWFKHPFFGVLNRDQSMRLIVIHNRHHLKIIQDILAK